MSCNEQESGAYRLNKAGVKAFKEMIMNDNKIELEQGMLLTNILIRAINASPLQLRTHLSEFNHLLADVLITTLDQVRYEQQTVNTSHETLINNMINNLADKVKSKAIDFKTMDAWDAETKVQSSIEQSPSRHTSLVRGFRESDRLTSANSGVVSKFREHLHEAIGNKPHKMKLLTAKELSPFRSVDIARESIEGKLYAKTLNSIEWGRNTGGHTSYINEHMIDDGPCDPSRGHYKGPIGDQNARQAPYF